MAPRRRPLHGTDLSLSTVGFGCWTLGGLWWGKPVERADAVRALHRAFDAGVNWVDTAPLYGYGRADEYVAEAVATWRGDEVLIATKVGVHWSGEHAVSLLTAEHIIADAEASLRRLKVDCIDLLQVHWPCQSETPLDETCAALQLLLEQGKVRALGLCNYDAETLGRASERCALSALQTPYSALRREFERTHQKRLPEVAQGLPMGVLAYEPLCRGLLTGKYHARSRFADSDLRSRDDRFQGERFLRALTVVSRAGLVARSWGVPLATLALAWAIRRPFISAVIAGVRTEAQAEQNAAAMSLAERDELDWDSVERVFSSFRG